MSDVVPYNQGFFSDGFIVEILPSAKKASLLFHLSYLCLAGFPDLERLIRSKATDCRHLFSSSESLLLQCTSTSDNMVNILFPMLRSAVEKNKPLIAVKYLEKARTWLHDVIKKVEDTAKEYERLDKDVASAASDVIRTKTETETKKKQVSKDMEATQKNIKEIENKVNETKISINKLQKELDDENRKLQQTVEDISSRNRKFGIAAVAVPIIGWIVNASQKLVNEPGDKAAIDSSKIKLEHLRAEKSTISQELWNQEGQLMSLRMAANKLDTDIGLIPNTEHLKDIQECLTKIQDILLKLKGFWEGIGVMLDNLKGKTFAVDEIVDDLADFKSEFLSILDIAQQAWKSFGSSCLKVMGTFSVQSKDAYKFLEMNPSSLSKEEWEREYKSVTQEITNLFKDKNPAIDQNPNQPAAIKPVA